MDTRTRFLLCALLYNFNSGGISEVVNDGGVMGAGGEGVKE